MRQNGNASSTFLQGKEPGDWLKPVVDGEQILFDSFLMWRHCRQCFYKERTITQPCGAVLISEFEHDLATQKVATVVSINSL